MNRMKALASLGSLLALALTQSACGRASEPAVGPDRGDAPTVDQTVKIDQAAMPQRYAGPLPTSVASFQPWFEGNPKMPPVAHTVDNILHGNPTWLARLQTAASAVPPAEASAWAAKWQGMFKFKSVGAPFCTNARAIMAGPLSTIRLAISGPFARACAKDDDLALVVRADTPASAVIEFYDPWGADDGIERRRPFDPRLIAAVRETILNGDQLEARPAAFILADQSDPRAVAALLALHSEVKDAERADDVAMAFYKSENAEGKQRVAAACKRQPKDPVCQPDQAVEAEEPAPEERVPVDAVKARVAQLSSLGFEKVGTVNVSEVNSESADVILVEAGHAYWFDVETGQYPNEHDSLMRSLALLVSPALDEAVFEEHAPEVEDESEPYQLVVYAAGKRYRTQAENLGDWYDVNAVLRLMNAVMEDRKAAARFTSLATQDQTMIVLAAPPAVVAKAAKEGLLELGEASEAERMGKEFEEQVLKSLRN